MKKQELWSVSAVHDTYSERGFGLRCIHTGRVTKLSLLKTSNDFLNNKVETEDLLTVVNQNLTEYHCE